MANVYLTEIPNAPGIQEMPTPNYPAIPAIRHKPLDLTVDFSQEAASLQQQPLPGGFKRGSDIVAGALASGARSAGEVGEGMQHMGRAIAGFAGVLQTMNDKANDAKDAIAEYETHKNREAFMLKFEADTTGMTFQEKMDYWNKNAPNVAAMNSSYGVRQVTKDKIASMDSAFLTVEPLKIQLHENERILKESVDTAQSVIDRAKQDPTPQNVEDARQMNEKGHQKQWWSDGDFAKNEDDLMRGEKTHLVEEKLISDPGWVKEQSDKALRGEQNDLWAVSGEVEGPTGKTTTQGEDKDLINKAYTAANNEVNRRQTEKSADISERLFNGEKMTKGDIEKEAKVAGMTASQTSTLLKQWEAIPIPRNETKTAEAMQLVDGYDARQDLTADGKHRALTKYNEAKDFIVTNVDQETQKILLKELEQKREATDDPKKVASSSEIELNQFKSDAKELWNQGAFKTEKGEPVPTGRDKDGKIIPGDTEAARKGSATYIDVIRKTEQFAKDHPDAKPGDILNYGYRLIEGTVNENLDRAGLPKATAKPGEALRPGYYGNIGIPGSNKPPGFKEPFVGKPGEKPPEPGAVPPTKAEIDARARGEVTGPGAPLPQQVSVHVYDVGKGDFRDASLPASTELKQQVDREVAIYDQILAAPGDIRQKFRALGSDVLAPEHQRGIIQEAKRVSQLEGLDQDAAAYKVVTDLRDQARQDAKEIEAALKAPPTASTKIGNSEAFERATQGDTRHDGVTLTAYTAGKNDPKMEGPNEVKDRPGQRAYSVEGFRSGRDPWASAAVDENSDLRGQFFVSNDPNLVGVVFKGEDIGPAVKGSKHVDINWDDPKKADVGTINNATLVRITPEAARDIAQNRTQGTASRTTGGSEVIASVSKVTNQGSTNVMTSGTLHVGRTDYKFNSGGHGRGSLPPGNYVVTQHMYSRDTPGMVVGDVGFSFALSNKYDQRVGGTRTLLRIHPDGGTAGTAGCIGIVGGPATQKQFRDELTRAIQANGGKITLRVG